MQNLSLEEIVAPVVRKMFSLGFSSNENTLKTAKGKLESSLPTSINHKIPSYVGMIALSDPQQRVVEELLKIRKNKKVHPRARFEDVLARYPTHLSVYDGFDVLRELGTITPHDFNPSVFFSKFFDLKPVSKSTKLKCWMSKDDFVDLYSLAVHNSFPIKPREVVELIYEQGEQTKIAINGSDVVRYLVESMPLVFRGKLNYSSSNVTKMLDRNFAGDDPTAYIPLHLGLKMIQDNGYNRTEAWEILENIPKHSSQGKGIYHPDGLGTHIITADVHKMLEPKKEDYFFT